MKDVCVKEFLQRSCSVFLFSESSAQKVSSDTELTVDAICIRISADKSFCIRQVMSAPVDSRVLNDELHFDIRSVLLHDFFFSQLPLFASTVIYNSHHRTFTLILFTCHRFLAFVPFPYPQCSRLCVTGIPDAMMPPLPTFPLNTA